MRRVLLLVLALGGVMSCGRTITAPPCVGTPIAMLSARGDTLAVVVVCGSE